MGLDESVYPKYRSNISPIFGGVGAVPEILTGAGNRDLIVRLRKLVRASPEDVGGHFERLQ